MEWAVPSTGGRRVVVFSLRCSSLESRVTWIFAPRSPLDRTTLSFPLFPQTPEVGRFAIPSARFWTSPSMRAVENYYHMKTLQWSLPQRSKRE
jgi:hypothetical protein